MKNLLRLSLLGAVLSMPAYASEEKFAVYYSDKAPLERFDPYQLLVLDYRYHPPLQALSEKGKTLLGYVSLGEVEERTPAYYKMLRDNNILIKENKDWKGSHIIDIRNPVWQKLVIEEIIPSVLRQGFDGLFFDTLDSPLELERSNPGKYKGMEDASVKLIKAVRMHYPSAKIMVNRSYKVLPEIAPYIEMVLGESVRSDYNFDTKTYRKVAEPLYQEQLRLLRAAEKSNAELKIYTLDYANPKDSRFITDIYSEQRANGFIPYVTTIGLDEITDEPGVQ